MKRVTGLWCVLMLLIAVAAEAQIQPSFFGMGVVTTLDLPKVTYGTLSHPPVAWTMVEAAGAAFITGRIWIRLSRTRRRMRTASRRS